MKRKFTSIAGTMLLIGMILVPNQSFAADQNPITVYVNGQQLDFEVSPVIQDGSTLVPIRAITEKLGLKVSWDPNTSTIFGTKDGLNIQMSIGNTRATVNGNMIMLGVPPTIVNGSTLVPLRFIGESYGNNIFWDEVNRRIDIKTSGLSNAKVVTRSEVSKFLVRSLDLLDERAQVNLIDVSINDSNYRFISSAIHSGIMFPYEDGSFRPSVTISRVEYAAILAKALNLPTSPSNFNAKVAIKDMEKVPLWAADIVQAIINTGLMELNEDGTFDGNSQLKLALEQPNMKLKEIKDKYSTSTPTPAQTQSPTNNSVPLPSTPKKMDRINQEYLRHTQALQTLQIDHDKVINLIKDNITSIRRSSIVGYYSEEEYNQKLTSLQTQAQAKQNLVNALLLDNSWEASSRRMELTSDIADLDQRIKNLQDGRSAQVQIQALEDMSTKEDREYQSKIQAENALYQSNLVNIK